MKNGAADVGFGARVPGQPADGQRLDGQRDARQLPPVDAVRHRPCHEDQQRGGRELGQAEQAQRQLAAREVEDLLAEHCRQQRHRGRRTEDRRQQCRDRPGLARSHRTTVPTTGLRHRVRRRRACWEVAHRAASWVGRLRSGQPSRPDGEGAPHLAGRASGRRPSQLTSGVQGWPGWRRRRTQNVWAAPRHCQSRSSELRSRIAAHERLAMARNMRSAASVRSAVAKIAPSIVISGPWSWPSR